MEKEKTSKKTLRGLITDYILEALSKTELPKPSKKVKKTISKHSKRLASLYANLSKREQKKKNKTEKSLTYVEDVLKAKKKSKKAKAPKLEVK